LDSISRHLRETVHSKLRKVVAETFYYDAEMAVRALYADGSAYGSYARGGRGQTYVYHCYNNTQTARGRILNNHPSTSYYMLGKGLWDSTNPCP